MAVSHLEYAGHGFNAPQQLQRMYEVFLYLFFQRMPIEWTPNPKHRYCNVLTILSFVYDIIQIAVSY